MAATRKTSTPPAPDTVTVTVTPGVLVYLDDEQRDGTITDVPTAIAAIWERQGWANIQH